MADNNTMALAFAMGVPLCLYSMWLIPWKIFRVGLLAMLVANVAAIVMTYSRGAAVALAAGALVLILHTKRRVWVLATMALLAIPPVLLVKDTYLQRLSTLKDPTAEGSAYSRIVLAKVSLKMAADYPVFGVGFGRTNQQALIYRYLPSDVATDRYGIKVLHNTYAQTMVDSGIPALLLHCALLFGTIGWLEVSYRRIRVAHPALTAYPLAIQNALVVFAVGSTFLSRVEFDLYYFLLMAAAVWWEQERKLPLATPVIQPLTLRQSVAPKPAVIGPAHRALPQIWQSLAPGRARGAKR
jgi:O-antigen ligase